MGTTWLVPIEDLMPEQMRAVMLPTDAHKLIVGAPGSGKTLTLVHRAAYLRDRLKLDFDQVRIFVYTNALHDYIAAGLRMLGIPDDCVMVLEHWCRLYHEQHIGRRLPFKDNGPDFDAIRRAVMAHVEEKNGPPPYEAVLVDEGQDLTDVAYRILRRIGRHLTVCMDHRQQLYDHGTRMEEILGLLGLRRSNLGLLEAYRCCPYISRMAATFISTGNERTAYLRQVKTEQVERQTPLLYLADSAEDEQDRLIEVVRGRMEMGDRIGILFPSRRYVYGYAKALTEAGLEVEIPPARGRSDSEFPVIDFDSDRPKLMPYHSAKGLTFDSVFLPRLTPRLFDYMSPERIRNLLFVGITRATRWVYMSSQQGRMLEQLDPIYALGQEGGVTVQTSATAVDMFDVGIPFKGHGEGEEIVEEPSGGDDDLTTVF